MRHLEGRQGFRRRRAARGRRGGRGGGCSGGGEGSRGGARAGEPPAHRRPTPDRMPDGGPQSADEHPMMKLT